MAAHAGRRRRADAPHLVREAEERTARAAEGEVVDRRERAACGLRRLAAEPDRAEQSVGDLARRHATEEADLLRAEHDGRHGDGGDEPTRETAGRTGTRHATKRATRARDVTYGRILIDGRSVGR